MMYWFLLNPITHICELDAVFDAEAEVKQTFISKHSNLSFLYLLCIFNVDFALQAHVIFYCYFSTPTSFTFPPSLRTTVSLLRW